MGTNAAGDADLGNLGYGISIDGGNGRTIGGLTEADRNLISGNALHGVYFFNGANGDVVEGNDIGTTVDGMGQLGNGGSGVYIDDSSDIQIGGTEEAARNVISGNSTGISIVGSLATGNHISANYIGVAADGVTDLGNTNRGVFVGGLSNGVLAGADNVIGGPSAGERNIISGNGINGYGIGNIFLQTLGTVVQGNYIGTDWTGTVQVASDIRDGVGIWMQDDKDSLIAGNLIAGNDIGIRIDGRWVAGGTENTRIQGNLIGTKSGGDSSLPNRFGVYIAGHVDSDGVTHPINNVLIGGADDGVGNVISGNIDAGILAFGPGVQGLHIQGNQIGTDIDGVDALPNGGSGVLIQDASGVLIGGETVQARNIISGNIGSGISIVGGGGHTIQGNYIGTTADGMAARGNLTGIRIQDASGTLIGGETLKDRNIISGNGSGVIVIGLESDGNRIIGNYIGVGADGRTDLGNFDGIDVGEFATNTVIGGTTATERNIISGNHRFGILLNRTLATTVQGNYVGTDSNGIQAVPNHLAGIRLIDDNGSLIGGTEGHAANLVSGNLADGIFVSGEDTSRLRILGNRIGTDISGTAPLANTTGIAIEEAAGVLVGDVPPGGGNVIAYNRQAGISIGGDASIGNTIRGNSIHTNGGLGIDLGGDGVTPNDKGDLNAGIFPDEDTGPNTLQNFPETHERAAGVGDSGDGASPQHAGCEFCDRLLCQRNSRPNGIRRG